MLHFDFATADATDKMMMLMLCKFIPEVSIASLCGTYQSVLCEKFQRSIDRRFSRAGEILFRPFVHIARGEMRGRATQHVEDRHPLWSNSITAREVGEHILRHKTCVSLIASFYNNFILQYTKPFHI